MNEVFEPGVAVDGPPVRSAGRGGGTKKAFGVNLHHSLGKPRH